jgi:MoaA/NifB/PqqE/SkfB family radical SAM enzyme/polysaccharide pyruvyl transferase WcaK-like protein
MQVLARIFHAEKEARLDVLIHAETYNRLLSGHHIYQCDTVYAYDRPRTNSFEPHYVREHFPDLFNTAYDDVVIPLHNDTGDGYKNVFSIARKIRTKRYIVYPRKSDAVAQCGSLDIYFLRRFLRQVISFESLKRWKTILLPTRTITELQMPVVHVCNSHCVMCNVWKNTDDTSIKIKDYAHILSDALFRDIEAVGLNGGEPTLRKDLYDIVVLLSKKLPRLQSVNVITNGIAYKDIINTLVTINAYLIACQKRFHVYVSLDGAAQQHDRNRGTAGNHASVVKLIDALVTHGIVVSVGCTLTKHNVYAGDDVLLFAKQKGIDARVRLGVDIARLYNHGFFASQHYTQEEMFHLVQFFHKLYVQRKDMFYYSLFRQLADGQKRLAGCAWRHSAVTLDAHGDLSYCSVASPILGNCLKDSAYKLYHQNMHVRHTIRKDDCGRCRHDLKGSPTMRGWLEFRRAQKRRQGVEKKVRRRLRKGEQPFRMRKQKRMLKEARRVIITGWWGTETHGDKAILGELLLFLRSKCPQLESITITVIPEFEYVVDRTLQELDETGLIDVCVVKAKVSIIDFAKSQEFRACDFVIIGGGPLQQIPYLVFIEKAFVRARQMGKGTLLFGCGIHPCLLDYAKIVSSILRHTQYGFFRDIESFEAAKALVGKYAQSFHVACDPAVAFVKKWHARYGGGAKVYDMCTLLRANTSEFLIGQPLREIEASNHDIAGQIALFLSRERLKTALLAMHSLWMGGDDRLYNRYIIGALLNKEHIDFFEHRIMGLHEVLSYVDQTRIVLCSRYHGHLFAFAMNIPFISVDYAGEKNKVDNFVRRIGRTHARMTWDTVTAQELHALHASIEDAYDNEKEKQSMHCDELLQSLKSVYALIE